ncbi:MAG TPA: hypothetical protein DEQ14_07155 [Treponema sp.]|nr:hypothetical protein [Treponema sp.]
MLEIFGFLAIFVIKRNSAAGKFLVWRREIAGLVRRVIAFAGCFRQVFQSHGATSDNRYRCQS